MGATLLSRRRTSLISPPAIVCQGIFQESPESHPLMRNVDFCEKILGALGIPCYYYKMMKEAAFFSSHARQEKPPFFRAEPFSRQQDHEQTIL